MGADYYESEEQRQKLSMLVDCQLVLELDR